ncbi:MAG: aminoglycoside phosphotransferase family protein [Pseudonocardiales bacterium]
MRIERLHDDEFHIDDALVRRLLASQMPQWAELPLRLVQPSGTDNVMIRLGDDLALRLPRTPGAASGITKEQRLVPLIAAQVPVAVPAPVGFGVPGDGYPWPWSVYPWVIGRNPQPGEADVGLAGDLADFARVLRGLDTFGLVAEGLLHSYRVDSIQLRDATTRQCIDESTGLIDTVLVIQVWDQVRRVCDFTGPRVWMHSDLQPGNILVYKGKLAAVIDWGSLALGDPAVDCIVAWTLLTPDTRIAFRDRIDVDDETWRRARAWALSIALVALPYYIHTNEQITAWARYAIGQVVGEVCSGG